MIPVITQALMAAKGASKGLAGSKLPMIEQALSKAVCQYILVSAFVTSTNNVIGPGAGTQTGKILGLSPNTMSGLMVAKAASLGLAGKDIKSLFDTVSFGVVNSMNSVLLQGVVIGGGLGTGTGKIIGLVPFVLTGIIMIMMKAVKMYGDKTFAMASAIAFGVCTHIMSNGTVSVTNIGAAAGPPIGPITIPAAPGIGRLV